MTRALTATSGFRERLLPFSGVANVDILSTLAVVHKREDVDGRLGLPVDLPHTVHRRISKAVKRVHKGGDAERRKKADGIRSTADQLAARRSPFHTPCIDDGRVRGRDMLAADLAPWRGDNAMKGQRSGGLKYAIDDCVRTAGLRAEM